MFHGLQNLVLGILLRYTPLSMKELLELYTKQTVDLCECDCFVLLLIDKAFSFSSVLQVSDKYVNETEFLYSNVMYHPQHLE